ncbi:hypothetical protein [Streptomyces sp. NBC_01280]|uniref:hypothetical protein n=1 Tax=Streptomyces sp. NBC_01280 TaxID=2903810 RepID=UPI002E32D2CF|nr:hypothetical protein [Streptomyces sp. NBC_01280]
MAVLHSAPRAPRMNALPLEPFDLRGPRVGDRSGLFYDRKASFELLGQVLIRRSASRLLPAAGQGCVRVRIQTRRLRLRIHTWLAPDTAPEAVLDAHTACSTYADSCHPPGLARVTP